MILKNRMEAVKKFFGNKVLRYVIIICLLAVSNNSVFAIKVKSFRKIANDEYLVIKSNFEELLSCYRPDMGTISSDSSEKIKAFDLCVSKYLSQNLDGYIIKQYSFWILQNGGDSFTIFKCSDETIYGFEIHSDFAGQAICFQKEKKFPKLELSQGFVFFEHDKVSRISSKLK
ncbi:MAG: hypothetical protein A2385_09260 [Bdellovibrionales bacterium RIFOXYB1_FULL_39_21]|nr:MAG: hypothetical protein A2385_09260 [Bdellovibrionales bacterium RIFOXYB1_FULL_39_21]OFZ45114.1 MAG: hypothetical protein A2485_05280 [Bdellovibrionales bacterium RIFOXYC12_FULL_39_17]HLE09967.1 hypothetical protein [Bacteriovoracaceae bacterium]